MFFFQKFDCGFGFDFWRQLPYDQMFLCIGRIVQWLIRKQKYVRSVKFHFTLQWFFFVVWGWISMTLFSFHLVMAFFFFFGSEWVKVEEDCRRAIQLDNASVKVCNSFHSYFYGFTEIFWTLPVFFLSLKLSIQQQPSLAYYFLSSYLIICRP